MTAAVGAALERIRDLEERPDYMGPKITGYISSVAAMQDLMVRGGGDFMPRVIEDATVGAIGRGCAAAGLDIVFERWQYRWYVKVGRSLTTSPVLDGIEDRSLALAALLAWEAAIGGGEKD
jgi:hypothetical protein